MNRHDLFILMEVITTFTLIVILALFVSSYSATAKLMSEKETADLLKQQPKIIFSQKKSFPNGHLVEYWVMDKNGITYLCGSWMEEKLLKVQARCFDGR